MARSSSAAPDGYSILFTPISAILLAPLVQKMSFDPDKSLTPVTNVGTGSQVIAVKRSLPVNNLAEFLAYAKANPGKLNFAAAGTNNISHLAPLLLFKRAGVEVVMVPSRGEPQAISDLMAGNVDFYFGNTSVLLAQSEHPAIKLAGGRHRAARCRARRTCRPLPKPCRALSSRHGTASWCRTERLRPSSTSCATP